MNRKGWRRQPGCRLHPNLFVVDKRARLAVYIGFLGYFSAMMALAMDIGRPDRFWHPWYTGMYIPSYGRSPGVWYYIQLFWSWKSWQ